MNPEFYPIMNLFLDQVFRDREMSISDVVLTLCRRYDMTPERARDLILRAKDTRWFRMYVNKNVVLRSAGLRTTASVDIYRDVYAMMDDGIWRDPTTISTELRIRTGAATDVCVLFEAVGVFDSKQIWPNETVYGKIIGAEPVLYSPNFDLT